jgi:hypothetical protein
LVALVIRVDQLADIAQLGFAADTSGLKDAKASMEALVPAAKKADASGDKLSSTLAKVDATADKLASAAAGLSSAVTKMNMVLDASRGEAVGTAAAFGTLVNSASKVGVTFNSVASASAGAATATQATATAATGASASFDQLDSHVKAYRANLRQLKIDQMAAGSGGQQLDAHMIAYRDHLDKAAVSAAGVGKAIKFTAQDTLNASRQLSDIGVTLAMGMNPFMIAIQQGPQLLDILQNKAAVTGQTLGTVFRAAGAAIWAALAPLLPFIIGIAVVIGTIAAAFGLATRSINDNTKSITDGMGLTEKQLEKVKKAGVDTSVTIGDTFKATFEVLGERITEAFRGPIKKVNSLWDQAMDAITVAGSGAIKDIVATFFGGYYAIIALWKTMPSTFSGIAALIGNAFISMFEGLLNRVVKQINGINDKINGGLKAVGIDFQFATLDSVKLDRINNKEAKATADAIGSGYDEGYKRGTKAYDRFTRDVRQRAVRNRRKLITDAAGDAAKGAKTPKGPKSDGEKFEDIVKGANNDIAAQKARELAAGIDMTAEASATLEEKTKLLNEANSKGIKLTDAMRGKIDELSAAYGKAKVAADNAVGLKDVLKTGDKDIADVKAQADMIGLYGRQLAYATEMAKLLGEAKSKGMTPDAIAKNMPQFEGKANTYADASDKLATGQFMEQQRVAAKERMIALQQEQQQIGMSADETTRLRIENDLLAQARQKNVTLSPAEIASLQGTAAAQAGVENGVRRTREAIDFARDATKGFVSDLRSGLSQGESLFKSFGNAVMGVLDKVIDKLLDMTLSGEGGSTGGFLGSLTKIFSGVVGTKSTTPTAALPDPMVKFAKGGAFSNGVVDKASSFAMGQMGEAGPEGVLPLARGPDGSLGVQMHGGKSGGNTYAPEINVNNTYVLAGAMSSADVQRSIQQSAERTREDLRKSIPATLQEFQMNGALS